MDLYKKLKEKLNKLNTLLDELKFVREVDNGEILFELKIEGSKEYDAKDPEYKTRYFHLIDIRKAKIVKSGALKSMHSYLNLRNISIDKMRYTGRIDH